jgi:hypothetical protein
MCSIAVGNVRQYQAAKRLATYEDEWNQWKEATTFTGSANGYSTHSRAEDELNLREKNFGNSANGLCEDTDMKRLGKVTDESIAFGISQ